MDATSAPPYLILIPQHALQVRCRQAKLISCLVASLLLPVLCKLQVPGRGCHLQDQEGNKGARDRGAEQLSFCFILPTDAQSLLSCETSRAP